MAGAERKPRLHAVGAEEIEEELPARESSETRLLERDVHSIRSTPPAPFAAPGNMSREDRTIVRLHFQAGMTLAEIARRWRFRSVRSIAA